MGDTSGRKPALVLTILMMAVGTVVMGLLPTYGRIGIAVPVLLLLARLLQGFSTRGEWGRSTAFMAEWSEPGRRGFYTSFQQMSVAGGSLLGVGLAALLTSLLGNQAINEWGWRIPFLLGGLFGPIGLWLRREVDETPPYREVAAAASDAPRAASGPGHAVPAFTFLTKGAGFVGVLVVAPPDAAAGRSKTPAMPPQQAGGAARAGAKPCRRKG